MLKWALGGVAILVVIGLGLFWWLLAGFSAAPKTAPDVFSIETFI